ncbi:hypothetical protein FHQ13_008130 [Bacillus cereus]|nr:hypothetical protein FHQ13_008130 [Bacillus cereus]
MSTFLCKTDTSIRQVAVQLQPIKTVQSLASLYHNL